MLNEKVAVGRYAVDVLKSTVQVSKIAKIGHFGVISPAPLKYALISIYKIAMYGKKIIDPKTKLGFSKKIVSKIVGG